VREKRAGISLRDIHKHQNITPRAEFKWALDHGWIALINEKPDLAEIWPA
jgi:hypothetical protein